MSELTTMVAPQVDELALIESSGRRFVLAGQFAHAMCRASVLPEHLRTRRIDGKVIPLEQDEIEANCVMIANQALRWGVDPFAILPSTYVVGGKLGFDGKLIAAIVNQRGGLKGRLSRSYTGNGDNLTVTVSGTLQGEDEPRTVSIGCAMYARLTRFGGRIRNKSCGIPARLAGHGRIVQRCCWGF